MRTINGDPTKKRFATSESTSTRVPDAEILRYLIENQDAMEFSDSERRRELEGPGGMYYRDPAGLTEVNPVFDLLGFAGPKVVGAFTKRALGEAGEAVARQAAKGGQPYMALKSELDANVRELNNILPKYEEAYDLVKSGSKAGGFTEQSLARAEKSMDDYGAKITDLKSRISNMVNGPSGKITRDIQYEIEDAIMEYPDILDWAMKQNKLLQDAIASGNKAQIMVRRDELERLSRIKKDLEDLFDQSGISPERYMNRRDFGSQVSRNARGI